MSIESGFESEGVGEESLTLWINGSERVRAVASGCGGTVTVAGGASGTRTLQREVISRLENSIAFLLIFRL